MAQVELLWSVIAIIARQLKLDLIRLELRVNFLILQLVDHHFEVFEKLAQIT